MRIELAGVSVEQRLHVYLRFKEIVDERCDKQRKVDKCASRVVDDKVNV